MYLILPLFNCFDNLVFGRRLETIKKGKKETEKKLSYIRLLHRFSFKQRQICFDKKKNEKDQSRIRLWNPRLAETKRDAESLGGSRLEGFLQKNIVVLVHSIVLWRVGISPCLVCDWKALMFWVVFLVSPCSSIEEGICLPPFHLRKEITFQSGNAVWVYTCQVKPSELSFLYSSAYSL